MTAPLSRVCSDQPLYAAARTPNSLADGLTFLYNPGLGFPAGERMTPTIGYLNIRTAGDYVALDFPGDGGVSGAGPHAIVDGSFMLSQTGTVAMLVRSTDSHNDGAPNYHEVLASKGSAAGTLGGFTLRMIGAGAYNGFVGVQIKSSANVDVCNFTGTKAINDGKVHLVTLNWTQINGDFNYTFIDGVYDSGQFNSDSWAWDTVTDGVHIGGAQDTFWGYLLGQVAMIAFWKRRLNDQEQKSLADNPWQMWRAGPLPRAAVPYSGASVTPTVPYSVGQFDPHLNIAAWF